MSISTIQNFYKETITRAVTLTGATNIYVSSLPTPSEGYVVISPSSSSLREIVYYTAKGTDSNGTYLTVTLANRGLGGTTAQTHTIGEPVRMNVTAEHIKEISDALDQIVAGGAQDASTIAKGVTKLSVAPVSATEPIAVGDNDPRVPTTTQIAFIQTDFGDGSDGDVTISSPTTLSRDMYYNNLVVGADLNTAQFRIFVKGTLSGTGKILVGPGGNGGNASGETGGAAGSAIAAGYYPATVAGVVGSNAGAGTGANGNNGINQTSSLGSSGVNGGRAGSRGGAVFTGGIGGTITAVLVRFLTSKFQSFFGLDVTATGALIKVKTSASGGSGAGGISGPGGGGGGGGGSGAPGGILGIFAKTITGSFSLEAKGGNGGNGANAVDSSSSGGGGGAPGNGGYILLIYAVDNNWAGTASVAAGSKGMGGTGVGTGEDSQDGVAGTFSKIQIAQLI